MADEPVLTVVIPAWGPYVDQWLGQAIESVQHPEALIVVVDNGHDGPMPLQDAQVVSLPARVSLGAARNAGLAQVTTPYVMFFDADDVLLPCAIDRLLERRRPDRVHQLAGLVGEPPTRYRFPPRWWNLVAPLLPLAGLINLIRPGIRLVGATIIPTAVAREAGGFADTDDGEDWAFACSLGFMARVVMDETPGFLYRRHTTSLTRRHSSVDDVLRRRAMARNHLRRLQVTPGWLRAILPGVAVAQYLDARILRPFRRIKDTPLIDRGSCRGSRR